MSRAAEAGPQSRPRKRAESMVASLRFVPLCIAAVALSACGGLWPPISARPEPQNTVRANSVNRQSWRVLPQAKSRDLLYVSDQLFTDVYIFSYPALEPLGTLTGFSLPEGLCSDERGNVFVTDLLARKIVEYAHGASQPIQTLSEGGYPEGCSVDPSTGNLAVADYGSSGSRGDIAVFENARGTAVIYSDATMISFRHCGYDDKGNLFADGQKYNNDPGLAELPAGAGKLKDIEFGRDFDAEGNVQWDGLHVALMGNSARSIYRLAISGSKARVVGRTTLKSPRFAFSFWIQDRSLILTYVPVHSRAKNIALGVWAYPGGGKPVKNIRRLLGAYGLVVSPARRTSSPH